MKFKVKVKTGAKETKVEKVNESEYKVSVTTQPEKGKANEAMRSELAKYFGISKSNVNIVAGRTAKNKIVEIK